MPARGQRFFLYCQICDPLHHFLRRIVPRSFLPYEWDWDALGSFDFAAGELLSITDFMQKTEFRAKTLRVARLKIDVERERGKETKSEAVVNTVIAESQKRFYDQGRQYVIYLSENLLRNPIFKSDLVIGLGCFDYGVLFKFPKTVAVDCYQQVFQSFSSRGWLARELQIVHIDDYVKW